MQFQYLSLIDSVTAVPEIFCMFDNYILGSIDPVQGCAKEFRYLSDNFLNLILKCSLDIFFYLFKQRSSVTTFWKCFIFCPSTHDFSFLFSFNWVVRKKDFLKVLHRLPLQHFQIKLQCLITFYVFVELTAQFKRR